MANYTVKFNCGHSEQISLVGPTKDRERKIAYFEEQGQCSKCYAASKNKQMADNGNKEVEMKYGDYKNNYSDCKTKADSYNKEAKTIIVFVPENYEEKKAEKAVMQELTDLTNSEKASRKMIEIGSAKITEMTEKAEGKMKTDLDKAIAILRKHNK